jgi:hypothetical protein
MSDVLENPQHATMTVDALIESYVKLRDKKKEVEDRHKLELAPFKSTMDQLEAWLLEALNAAGLKSMSSPHGTAFRATRTHAVVREWQATLDYIRSNQAWDLLEARVSKNAALAIISETNLPIPGVETSFEVVCNVRRAGEKPPAGK